ncbi:tetratricopeptide repeat protein [Pseudomonas sp. M30-35]|uniref:tetratricopeptide repeat protein n=1 Tax=Pseudomonas sp. M30-35 TaxID=1981174 RepID=UPI000B3D28A1|nr:tetratricopeptide repeat protein [Pseudomonas sp. M30-35]ARU90466.1 hypothetical protein B9K09_22020 [Pseudomonas sp. M30-35]
MIHIRPRLGIAIFLHLILLSNVSQAKEHDASLSDLNILKTLHADLTGDGQDETILVARGKSGKEQPPILLIIDNGKVLVESIQALLPVENDYSPASYDGFEVEVSTSSPNLTSIIDIQGETTKVNYPSTAGKYLVLRTIEEGNSSYNFNLQFSYDSKVKGLKLHSIFLNTNNTSCDRSLKSVYVVKEENLLTTSLQVFNGREAFKSLKKTRQNIQTGNSQVLKLMQQESSVGFDQVLAAYKTKDKQHLKQVMATFIEGNGNAGICPAERYIANKYYFPNNPRWSNDLGFLFEQAGYFREAIELLNKVITEHPNRIVAYLNLADSYWAVGKKNEAKTLYSDYISGMNHRKMQAKIPSRAYLRAK